MTKDTVEIDRKLAQRILVWLDAEREWEDLDNLENLEEMIAELKSAMKFPTEGD